MVEIEHFDRRHPKSQRFTITTRGNGGGMNTRDSPPEHPLVYRESNASRALRNLNMASGAMILNSVCNNVARNDVGSSAIRNAMVTETPAQSQEEPVRMCSASTLDAMMVGGDMNALSMAGSSGSPSGPGVGGCCSAMNRRGHVGQCSAKLDCARFGVVMATTTRR